MSRFSKMAGYFTAGVLTSFILGGVAENYRLAQKGQLEHNFWGYQADFVTLDTGIKTEYICGLPSAQDGVPVFVFVRAKFDQLGSELTYSSGKPETVRNIPAMRSLMEAIKDFRRFGHQSGWRCNLVGPHPDFVGDHRRVYVDMTNMSQYHEDPLEITVRVGVEYATPIRHPDGTFEWGQVLEGIQQDIGRSKVENYQ